MSGAGSDELDEIFRFFRLELAAIFPLADLQDVIRTNNAEKQAKSALTTLIIRKQIEVLEMLSRDSDFGEDNIAVFQQHIKRLKSTLPSDKDQG